jgi:hypothetical protein
MAEVTRYALVLTERRDTDLSLAEISQTVTERSGQVLAHSVSPRFGGAVAVIAASPNPLPWPWQVWDEDVDIDRWCAKAAGWAV